jgi:hypothetical protein
MWKRRKRRKERDEQNRLAGLINSTATLQRWNDLWDPPGELSVFYYWSDLDKKYKERDPDRLGSEPVKNSVDESRDRMLTAKQVKEHWNRGGILTPLVRENQLEKDLINDSYQRLVRVLQQNNKNWDYEGIKKRFGYHRMGEQDRIIYQGITMPVWSVQQKINKHFGSNVIHVDGRLGPLTMRALDALDRNE